MFIQLSFDQYPVLLQIPSYQRDPAGVKGLGELGNVGTNAAISNAVYHATGIRIRDLPIRVADLIGTT